ncbi:MAG: DUF5677 domain-containing protein, partial [Elusimicrobiota bacterium]|nr:DUF5677 domain-containing protein [Elusimicrobiota bacterium]
MKFRKMSQKELHTAEEAVKEYPKKLQNLFLHITDFQNIAEYLLFCVDLAYFGKNKMLAKVMTFFAVKQKRGFDSIVELTKKGFDEEVLPLLRTMYETNIQIMNIILRENKEEYSQGLVYSQWNKFMKGVEESNYSEKENLKIMTKHMFGDNWKSKFKDFGIDKLDILSIAEFIDRKMNTGHYTEMYHCFYKYASAYSHSEIITIVVLNKKGRLLDKCLKPSYKEAYNNISLAGDMLIEALTNFVGSSNRPYYEPIQYMVVYLSIALGLNKRKHVVQDMKLPPNQKLPFNARCACGSGKEYRHCCINKKYTYKVLEDGKTIKREVPIGKITRGLIKKSEYNFRKKFGREMEKTDNLFWEVVEAQNKFKDQD